MAKPCFFNVTNLAKALKLDRDIKFTFQFGYKGSSLNYAAMCSSMQQLQHHDGKTDERCFM